MRKALSGYTVEDVDAVLDRCVATRGMRVSHVPELSSRPLSSLRLSAPVTADEVAQVQFRISFRGYALDEVDQLLDRVEAELQRS